MIRKEWTPEEEQYLMANFPDQNTSEVARILGRSYGSVVTRAHKLKIRKSEAFLADPKKMGYENLCEMGKASRFKKGNTSWNKGKKIGTRGRSSETQFKAGHLPHNTLENGATSIRNTRGRPYKWIRIAKGKWKMLHRVVWEKHHGPIKTGFNIQFIDGNTLNCDLKNLELVTKEENMRRNTLHRYPEEIKNTMRTIGRIKKRIKNAKK